MKISEDDFRRQIARGDERAFARFYYQYQDTVAKHAFRILKDREQTREIVQDVFLSLWKKHNVFLTIVDFDAYLFIATKNSCLASIRARIREQGKIEVWKEEQTYMRFVPDEHPNAVYELLDRAIDDLPPQQQKVYLLSRHSRKKYAEIADELNISKETVKKYLQLANQSIQSYIKRHKDVVISLFLSFFIS
ncbi:RNA polymerase sigma factor [Sphingobacterium gobiense]|uniref:RNA polymerase sigma-70 factor n=1 Tax=Sphingobacterium gobiense TaxID=1382456 RepID=A0A2S9JGE1_9SPHI|nr:sigma-70 family RNA polymerase sigma factor [Sphingobacterium gobiense]PRD51901.1 hypothetical protein C5749_16505 [Sphingobacterium gobiense]